MPAWCGLSVCRRRWGSAAPGVWDSARELLQKELAAAHRHGGQYSENKKAFFLGCMVHR